MLRLNYAGREVAVHPRRSGRFERVVDPQHYAGVVGSGAKPRAEIMRLPGAIGAPELLRPVLEYERLVGGRW